jgi:hypothetical protein
VHPFQCRARRRRRLAPLQPPGQATGLHGGGDGRETLRAFAVSGARVMTGAGRVSV